MLEVFIVLIFVLMNRVRGSSGETMGEYWGFKSSYSGSAYAVVLFALVCYSVSNSVTVALLSGLAYKLGESFGWGKWIGQLHGGAANPNSDEGKKNGIHWLANLWFNEVKHTKEYAAAALLLRGMLWFSIAYLPLVALGVVSGPVYTLLVVLTGFAFPTSFYVSSMMDGEGYWERGETIYGLLQGVMFVSLVVS